MLIVCPHCNRELNVSGDPPAFCAYCGQSLSQADPKPNPNETPTQPFRVETVATVNGTPDVIGGFRIVRRLGAGGMGVVLEGIDPGSGRHVAIKVLSEQMIDSPSTLERFRQEGRVASQIAHPRCVFVLRTDEDAGRPYIVMELMPGYTLRDLVAEAGALPVEDAIARILEVIDGLQEAHRLGVIHRDVKPSNCFLLEDGTTKVGDFGLCKVIRRDGHVTQSGAFVGTVLFSAPEQLRNDPLDYRADVYSVAATFYFLLTGKAPHSSESHTEAVARAASQDPPDVREFRHDVSRPLARIVRKGLHRDCSRRWQNLESMRAALRRQVPSQLTSAGLGLRVGAFVIDEALLSLRLLLPWEWVRQIAPTMPELVTYSALIGITWVYFTVTEGIWGASFGKRILGLRVARTDRFEPPGLKRAAIRAAIFALPLALPQLCYLLPLDGAGRILAQVFTTLLLGLGLAWPMRPRNAFRGVHEIVSKTRVVLLPWKERSREYPSRSAQRPLQPKPDSIPEFVGPYVVEGVFGEVNGCAWLAAEDRTLHRKTLIRLCEPDGPSVTAQRRELSRPGRLRWLACGNLGDRSWDAFVSPSGAPLDDIVRPIEPLTWAAARPILEQLARELTDAAADDSLPKVLTPDQVWIQSDGRVQLLDAPLQSPGYANNLTPTELLRHSAVQLLEGRPGGEESSAVHAPVPTHARPLLSRLMKGQSSQRDFAADLDKTRGLPREVTFGMKAGYLWILAILLSLGLFSMFASPIVGDALIAMSLHEQIREMHEKNRPDSEIKPKRDQYLAARDSLGWIARALMLGEPPADGKTKAGSGNQTLAYAIANRLKTATGEGSELQMKVVSAAVSAPIIFWPIAWGLWAFLFRGGIAMHMMGLCPVRRNGKRALRIQCAIRTLAVWLPIALLLLTVNALNTQSDVWRDVGVTLSWLTALLVGGYIYLGLIYPVRGLHDIIAGTWLVPE